MPLINFKNPPKDAIELLRFCKATEMNIKTVAWIFGAMGMRYAEDKAGYKPEEQPLKDSFESFVGTLRQTAKGLNSDLPEEGAIDLAKRILASFDNFTKALNGIVETVLGQDQAITPDGYKIIQLPQDVGFVGAHMDKIPQISLIIIHEFLSMIYANFEIFDNKVDFVIDKNIVTAAASLIEEGAVRKEIMALDGVIARLVSKAVDKTLMSAIKGLFQMVHYGLDSKLETLDPKDEIHAQVSTWLNIKETTDAIEVELDKSSGCFGFWSGVYDWFAKYCCCCCCDSKDKAANNAAAKPAPINHEPISKPASEAKEMDHGDAAGIKLILPPLEAPVLGGDGIAHT